MSWRAHVLLYALFIGSVFNQISEITNTEVNEDRANDPNEKFGYEKAKEFVAAHTNHGYSSEFIAALYQNLSNGMNLAIASGHPSYEHKLSRADTIRTFPTLGCKLVRSKTQHFLFTFNVSIVPADHEILHGVQLRIKNRGTISHRSHTFITAVSITGSLKSIVPTVELLEVPLGSETTWLINITRFYLKWKKLVNSNLTIPLFGVILANFRSRKPMSKPKILRKIRKFISKSNGVTASRVCEQVILVMYTETGEFIQRGPLPAKLETHSVSARSVQSHNKGQCRKVPMYVDFSQMGWDEWIVYPERFNSYKCVGHCTGFMSDPRSNPTNHALIQSLMRLVTRNNRIPAPCCSPTKLSSVSILYLEKGIVVIKYHEDMVIEECGCL